MAIWSYYKKVDFFSSKQLQKSKKTKEAVRKWLRLLAIVFFVFVITSFSAAISYGLYEHEDVSLVVRYFKIVQFNNNLTEIKMRCLVPAAFMEAYQHNPIDEGKIYFAIPDSKEKSKTSHFKTSVKTIHVEYADLNEFSEQIKETKKDFDLLMKSQWVTMSLELDITQDNLEDYLEFIRKNKIKNLDTEVYKTKLNFGEVTLLKFWAQKIFNKSKLYKTFNRIIE